MVRAAVIAALTADGGSVERSRHLDRGHAGGVGLQREQDEIEEDRHLLGNAAVAGLRDAGRRPWPRQPGLFLLQRGLHFSDGAEIVVELASVVRREPRLHAVGLIEDGVEDRAATVVGGDLSRGGLRRVVAKEQPKHLAHLLDRRHEHAAAGPGEFCAAGAGGARGRVENRKPCLADDCAAEELVERDVAVGHRGGVGRLDPGEERVREPVAAVGAVVEVREDGEPAAVFFEWSEAGPQLRVGPVANRKKVVLQHAEGIRDADESPSSRAGSLAAERLPERFKERQRKAHATGPQHAAAAHRRAGHWECCRRDCCHCQPPHRPYHTPGLAGLPDPKHPKNDRKCFRRSAIVDVCSCGGGELAASPAVPSRKKQRTKDECHAIRHEYLPPRISGSGTPRPHCRWFCGRFYAR